MLVPMPQTIEKILFVRTDRIGDVIVSTPALRALRKTYPQAWISVMVSPLTRQAVECNPDINEVLVFDKKAGLWSQFQFLRRLRARCFDVAIIAHCTNWVNWLAFLARIPRRIGYARRAGYLLTQALPNTKVLGEKHEADYILDLVKCVGVTHVERRLVFNYDETDLNFAKVMLKKMGLGEGRPVIAVHAGSRVPSRQWPREYYALLVQRLVREHDARVVLVGGTETMAVSREIVPAGLEEKVVDLTGLLNLRELGSVVSQCALLVSNDSGPMHIAAAVGTPTVAIFGRKRPGLGPECWGPLGQRDVILQKDVGCKECPVDDCTLDYKCLRDLSVEEVYQAVLSILEYNEVIACSSTHVNSAIPQTRPTHFP